MYHLMIALGIFFIVLSWTAVFLYRRGTLFERRWLLWVFVFAVLGAYAANQFGWIATEVGRQPWIVWHQLRTSQALSESLHAHQVLIPIGARGIYQGTLFDLLQPYSIAVGLFVVALFAMHGAIYLHLKTEGEIQQQTLRWTWHAFGLFLVLYILVTIMTLVLRPEVIDNFRKYPVAWGIVVFNVLAIGNIPRALYLDKPFYAFLSSAASILALVALFGMALFPNLVFSSLGPEFDLTIRNAASSQKTLGIMALVALIGMPMVLTYTGVVYWVFRGKVKLGEFSY